MGHTTRTGPCLQQSSFTHPHPPGKLHLSIGLGGGKLLCHRSMCPTSACPRDSGQNNHKVLLTPLPTVTKTPFSSFQKGKKFWKALPGLQITSTCKFRASETQNADSNTLTHQSLPQCHSSDVIKTKPTKAQFSPRCPNTHTRPCGDIDLGCSVPLTFQKGSAPFRLSPLHVKPHRHPKAKQQRFYCSLP